MEWILGLVQQGLSFMVPLIILLGLLIFVHELGHFLVAKFYGVKVEVFSLGFGKKIFQYQKGDTNYCISLIPFGGYVKMYGDDPTMDVPEESKRVSFLHKPVGQRIAIVLAGPLMNLFFAAVLFFLISMVGEEMVRPQVGDVDPQTAAYEAGFRSGDSIKSVNGKSVATWDEVKEAVEKNGSDPISFVVSGYKADSERKIEARTSLTENPNILSTEDQVGSLEGLDFYARAAQVGVPDPNSPAAQAGLKSLDEVIEVNGKSVEKFYELEHAVRNADPTKTLRFKFNRYDSIEDEEPEVVEASIDPNLLTGPPSLDAMGVERVDLYVAGTAEDQPAAKAGVSRGDKIVSINNNFPRTWEDLVESVRSYDKSKGPLQVELLAEGDVRTVAVKPEKIEQPTNTGGKTENYAMGIFRATAIAAPGLTVIRTSNPAKGFVKGLKDTWHWTKVTCLSFVRLVQARVSARSIGGPIMIGQLASRTFKMGLSHFLKIMAIISINLFIINMLPVPVLDGGHLVFFTIEALRGAPLSMRKMEIAQQIGLVLLLSLMALAIFNDVTRIIEN